MYSRSSHTRASFFAALALVAFGLNWIWEMAQMPAYSEMAGRSWRETLFPCTVASLEDLAVTFGVYGVVALAAGQLPWGAPVRSNLYATAALLGAGFGVALEWRAMALRTWSYTGLMPVVPLLGVGLWPTLQPALLIPAAVRLAAWWSMRRETDGRPISAGNRSVPR